MTKSIEQLFSELTAAVENLTEAFIAHTNDAAPKSTGKAKAPVADKAPVQEKVPAEAKKETPAKKPVVKASEVDKILEAEDAAAATIPYSDIQTLIKANVATKRPIITKVLAKYGIGMATELLEEQYKPFYDELKAELGKEADLA